jgi:uncharacterized integral membrane protein
MPFTAAHPAIVLPFLRIRKGYISATALIIGSISPDFEYFLKMKVRGVHSHTIAGLFYFDLPVTVGLAFIFHTIVKNNLIRNLPSAMQQKYDPLLQFNFVHHFKHHYIAFFIFAINGSASHIFWDSFTHEYGYFAQELTAIKDSRVAIGDTHFPMFFFLQHLSTLVGLLAIAAYVFAMKKHDVKTRRLNIQYWILISGIMIFVVFLRFLIRSDDTGFGNIVVTLIAGCCVGLIVMGFKKYE